MTEHSIIHRPAGADASLELSRALIQGLLRPDAYPHSTRRVELLERFLVDRMRCRDAQAQPEVASVMLAAERNPSISVASARDLAGLSTKRFNALFRAQVGLPPKAYFRVRRLQAALRALDAGTPGARIAADLGYFDQAHFVREFQAFAAITPTQYARRRSTMPGHIEIAATPG